MTVDMDRLDSLRNEKTGNFSGDLRGRDEVQISRTVEEYVLLKRSSLVGYYFVLVACMLMGGVLGWLSATSFQPPRTSPSQIKTADAEPVLLSGEIRFIGAAGLGRPDAGAVVIVVPADRYPERPLPIEGLRPWDPDSVQGKRNLEKLNELGGAWTKADEEGQFNVVLPASGDYWVLVISKHLARPKSVTELRNRGIDELDFAELSRYFERVSDLVGPQNYRWERRTLDIAGGKMHLVFDNAAWLGLDKIGG